MFVRTNILKRKFMYCSNNFKTTLFKTFCNCFYDIALWSSYNVGTLDKLRSCYNKCIKLFFGYSRCSSLTSALLETGLPCWDTVLCNYKLKLKFCIINNDNALVKCFSA